MSAGLPIAACIGLLSLAGPEVGDLGQLKAQRAEARELQRAGQYGAAAARLDRFTEKLERGPTRHEAERLVARYRALDRAWQRAEADPARHARTFVVVLNAGGQWVPPTPQDAERALRVALAGDPGLAARIAERFHLVVPHADARFEAALRRELARCGVTFRGSGRALQVEQTSVGRPGSQLSTKVSVAGKPRLRASGPARTGLSPDARGERAAGVVLQALVQEIERRQL